MKHLAEYRDADTARRLAAEIGRIVTRPWAIMEVCGGQTHSIIRHGIDQLLPPEVELIHGPGCPVCVTPVAFGLQTAMTSCSRRDSSSLWWIAASSSSN
jgi:hydrogenase expression/formation protein HypD